MIFLPKEIEDIIIDYKLQLEHTEKFYKVCEGIDNLQIDYHAQDLIIDDDYIEINNVLISYYLNKSKYNKSFVLQYPKPGYRKYCFENEELALEQMEKTFINNLIIKSHEEDNELFEEHTKIHFDKNHDFHFDFTIYEECMVCGDDFDMDSTICCFYCDDNAMDRVICEECNVETKTFLKCNDCDKYRCEWCERNDCEDCDNDEECQMCGEYFNKNDGFPLLIRNLFLVRIYFNRNLLNKRGKRK